MGFDGLLLLTVTFIRTLDCQILSKQQHFYKRHSQ